jgi:hypothetical protein
VDTIPHAYCVPGTTWTNNTAFLLYGSGLNKGKGRTHSKANGRNLNGIDGFAGYCAMLVYVESEKANSVQAMLFLEFWLNVDMAGCNGMAFRSSMLIF